MIVYNAPLQRNHILLPTVCGPLLDAIPVAKHSGSEVDKFVQCRDNLFREGRIVLKQLDRPMKKVVPGTCAI